MSQSHHKSGLALILAIVLCACGQPPSQTAGGGDWPVQAVVAPAREQPLNETLALVADLQAKESIEIRSELDARVTEINFAEGDAVEAGAVLARLDAGKLSAEVAEARARYELARQDYERGKTLVARKTISQQQFDQYRAALEAARAGLRLTGERRDDAVIVAPFRGLTGERHVSPGQYVDRGQLLSTLVQIDPLEVAFNVPERYVAQLAVGQKIEVKTAAFPEQSFRGDVYFIAPALDPRSRTVLVKAYVGNADGRLKPGMYASLELTFRVRPAALVIPENAVTYRGDATSVVVMNAEDRAEFRPVKLGARLSGVVEILDGVKPGERVIVEGHQKLAPGTRILVSPDSERYGIASKPAGADAG
jgi:membrane fusion protein (multidrug efflux system)